MVTEAETVHKDTGNEKEELSGGLLRSRLNSMSGRTGLGNQRWQRSFWPGPLGRVCTVIWDHFLPVFLSCYLFFVATLLI